MPDGHEERVPTTRPEDRVERAEGHAPSFYEKLLTRGKEFQRALERTKNEGGTKDLLFFHAMNYGAATEAELYTILRDPSLRQKLVLHDNGKFVDQNAVQDRFEKELQELEGN